MRQRVIWRRDDHMRMWPKRLTFNAKIARWPTHQGKIDIVIAKRFNGLCSIPDDKVEIDSCMLAQKCRNEMSREVLGCRYRAESNTAAVKSLHSLKGIGEIQDPAIDARCGTHDFTSGIGGPQAVSGSIDESEPEIFFKKLYPRG